MEFMLPEDAQLLLPPKPNELDMATFTFCSRGIRDVTQLTFRIGIVEVDRRWNDSTLQRAQARQSLSAAAAVKR